MRRLRSAFNAARPSSPFGGVGFLAWLDELDGSDLFADPAEARAAAETL